MRTILILISLIFSICSHQLWAEAATETKAGMDGAQLPEALAGYALSKKALRDTPQWQPPKRILITLNAFGITAGMEDVLDGIELVVTPGLTGGAAARGDFDAALLMCGSALDQIGSIRWVHTYSAGVEGCLTHKTLLANPDALVTNSRGAAAATIAEHAVAMMMSLGRKLPTFRDKMKEAEWASRAIPRQQFSTVRGKTVLVLGLGRIGTETARLANGLGMHVMATRHSRREGPDFVDYVGLSSESVELAAKADVVINALPYTPATKHIVNAEFLEAMPAHATFINVGRGGTVDTEALIKALEEKSIAAAGLDVTEPEPLPANSKLWAMDNVLITPHIAASSEEALRLTGMIARENLKRFINGDKLINPVNRKRAY